MKKFFNKNLMLFLGLFLFAGALVFGGTIKAEAADGSIGYQNVYRLYNQSSGEHLYTTDANEVKGLVAIGWIDEGIGWYGADQGKPVYRLYLESTGFHLYTSDENEIEILTTTQGWSKDFVDENGKQRPMFYDCTAKNIKTVPVYRLYQKVSYEHLLTTSEEEYNNLASLRLDGAMAAHFGFEQYWDQEGEALRVRGLGSGLNGDNTVVPANIEVQDGSVNGVTIENETVGFERAISADMILNGTGTGSHAKLVILGGGEAAVSFGIQYDSASGTPYTGTAQLMVENAHTKSSTGGQFYYRRAETALNVKHTIMIGFDADTDYVYCYEDGALLLKAYNPNLKKYLGTDQLAMSVEASGRKDGDTFDAVFTNIKLKNEEDGNAFTANTAWGWTRSCSNESISVGISQTSTGYVNNGRETTLTHGTTVGQYVPTVNSDGTMSIEIKGTISGLNGGDWDSRPDDVSGKINFHDMRYYSIYSDGKS